MQGDEINGDGVKGDGVKGEGINSDNNGRLSKPNTEKEWSVIERLLHKALDDQSKSRRWGIFFKCLTFVYLFSLLFMFNPGKWQENPIKESDQHVGLVDINGMIAANEDTTNSDAMVTGLRKAFEADNATAILMRINSPGGSPVQSAMVYDEIMRLKALHPSKKVYAAITDLGASGAYYIASAADEIYADTSSIVGSIGVISPGFGFTELLDNWGVERRVFSAGKNKAILDPFLPVDDAQRAHFEALLVEVHQQFISSVKAGRGDRLVDNPDIFSGLFWTGNQALALGLIDGLGSPGYVAREVVGQEEIVNYTYLPNPVDSFFKRIGVNVMQGLLTSVKSQPLL